MRVRHSLARRRAFTLIEILVVIAIIALLAALLFPAFSRARESGRQTTCQTNLQQLSIAIQQYFQDERRYPDSLVDLLPSGSNYNQGGTTTPIGDNVNGYLKNGAEGLLCPDDDLDNTVARSSYGALQKFPTTTVTNATPTVKGQNADPNADVGFYAYNYWGYDQNGFAYISADAASQATPAPPSALLVYPTVVNTQTNAQMNGTFNHPTETTGYDRYQRPSRNVFTYSLANRFAPSSTIVTHCMFHRLQTANNLTAAGALSAGDPNSLYARDIILRLDGTVKSVDVSTSAWTAPASSGPFQGTTAWQRQTPTG